MSTEPTIAERVRKTVTDFLVAYCGADPAKVTDTAHWSDEFGAVSLDQIDIAVTIEEAFPSLELTDEDIADTHTIADAIKVVEAKLAVPA